MSSIIGTALVMMGQEGNSLDINSWNLEIPENVLNNLSGTLLSYLSALQKHGYAMQKRRRVFIIGNTGR